MGYTFDQRMTVLGPHVHDGVPLVQAGGVRGGGAAAGVPLRTAQRWLAAYLTQGATRLHRAGQADKDRHRLPDELLEVIEGMALRRPSPHAAEVHRAAVKIAAEQGWKAPSYTVVREVIAGLDCQCSR